MAMGEEAARAALPAMIEEEFLVVSYKLLSRRFGLPVAAAKRVLGEFAESHKGNANVAAVHCVVGVAAESPHPLRVELVRADQLPAAVAKLKTVNSQHVYSVSPTGKVGPGLLWGSEREDMAPLFNEELHKENCLRDNRWGAVQDPRVVRTHPSRAKAVAAPEPKLETPAKQAPKEPLLNFGAKPKNQTLTAMKGGAGKEAAKAPGPPAPKTEKRPEVKAEKKPSKGKAAFNSMFAKAGAAKAKKKKEEPPAEKEEVVVKAEPVAEKVKQEAAKAEAAKASPPRKRRPGRQIVEESDSESDEEMEEPELEPEPEPEPEPTPKKQKLNFGAQAEAAEQPRGKRRVAKTTINSKGEEVTEMVWEDDEEGGPSSAPAAQPAPVKEEKPKPAPKPKAAAKPAPAKAGGVKKKKAGKPKQAGIAAFFSKK